MNDAGKALLIVLAIDLFFMFAQVGMAQINPEADFYSTDGNLLSDYSSGNYTILEVDADNLQTILPSSTEAVTNDDAGNVFTDLVKSVRNWFLDTTGLSYIAKTVNAVPNFLMTIHLPIEIVYGLGALWHGYTIFLFIMLVWGR